MPAIHQSKTVTSVTQANTNLSANPIDTEAESTREKWQAENAEAIESSNKYVERNGLPLEKYRNW